VRRGGVLEVHADSCYTVSGVSPRYPGPPQFVALFLRANTPRSFSNSDADGNPNSHTHSDTNCDSDGSIFAQANFKAASTSTTASDATASGRT
jgi:hypothetical protein